LVIGHSDGTRLRHPIALSDLDGAVVDGREHAGGIAGHDDVEHGGAGALGETGGQRGAEPIGVLDADAPASVPGRRRCQNALWRRLREGGGERRCPRIRIWGFLGAETVQGSFHGVGCSLGFIHLGLDGREPKTHRANNPSPPWALRIGTKFATGDIAACASMMAS
jgi:hypothetical protein